MTYDLHQIMLSAHAGARETMSLPGYAHGYARAFKLGLMSAWRSARLERRLTLRYPSGAAMVSAATFASMRRGD